jgi:Tfp pilus assembly protein PilV
VKTARPARGLTLIEVLIALGVLVLGVTGTILSILHSSTFLGRAAHLEEATTLAQSLASALSSVPYTAELSGSVSPFADSNTGNNGDIADSQLAFAADALPTGAGAPDHSDSELAGSSIASSVVPLSAGSVAYERYWNVAPLPSGNGVAFAVIVRWDEAGTKNRVVVIGTRYRP